MGGKFCQICSFPHPPCYMHSYIAAELFNMCKGILFPKESCFRSCKLTTDVPTVDRVSNRSVSTQAMALWNLALYLGISSGFGMLVYLKNLSLIEFQDRYLVLFCLFSVIDGVELLWMGSLHKNIHLMLEFLKSLFKAQGPTLFLLYINDLPDYTTYNMTVYEVGLYLYKFTILPWMEYCCHLWDGAPSCYLKMLDKLQKRIFRTARCSFAVFHEPLGHRQNVASLRLSYRYYFGDVRLNRLTWFHFLILKEDLLEIAWFFCHHS